MISNVLGSVPCPQSQPKSDRRVLPWRFVRQSVYRPAFDPRTQLLLADIVPARVNDLDTMHPVIGPGTTEWQLADGCFKLRGGDAGSGRWMYAFNAFSCHELTLGRVPVGASVFWSALAAEDEVSLTLELRRSGLDAWAFELSGVAGDSVLIRRSAVLSAGNAASLERIVLQGQGSGIMVFAQFGDTLPRHVLSADYPAALDFRRVRLAQNTQVVVGAVVPPHVAEPVCLRAVRHYFSAGIGIADIRAITTPDGLPLLERNRVFVTASLRGRGLPHSLQGVLSFDPSLCDLRLEGVIVFDCGDACWRNEIASHLMHDPATGDWFGLTTGFSGFGDDPPTPKLIRSFRTRHDPRFGFSVIPASPSGIVGDYEDPALFRETATGKWRLAVCIGQKPLYHAMLFESDHPDRDFQQIAGPTAPDATGMQILNLSGRPVVLYGSAERCLHVASAENLSLLETIQMDLPPWREGSGSRVWPAVIPLPAGSPVPAVMLTMDRLNHPDIPHHTWTYGSVYFYHAVPASD